MSAREVVRAAVRALFLDGKVSALAVILRLLALVVPVIAWPRGVLAIVVGLALSPLLSELGRAIALSAYTRAERPLWSGLVRLPSLLAIAALEIAVEVTLLAGALAAIAVLPAAIARALAAAPPLALVVVTFVIARVAIALAGRGLDAATAMVHAADLVLRQLPSLVRLGARLLVSTLPLTVPALLLASAGAVAGELVAGALVATAALWAYAALAIFAGRDPRLVGG